MVSMMALLRRSILSPSVIICPFILFLSTGQLPEQLFNKSLVLERFAVINIAWSYHKTQQFSHLIADQMKFEAIEPSHRTPPSLNCTFKDLVHMNTRVPAYAKQCAVYETDSGAFSHTSSLHKKYEWDYKQSFQAR